MFTKKTTNIKQELKSKKIIMKAQRPITLVLILIFMSVKLSAQDILQSYIDEGIESNLALKQENQILEQNIESLKQARSLFFPRVDFNASYTAANGGRTIDVPVGDLLNPVYTTLNQFYRDTKFSDQLTKC